MQIVREVFGKGNEFATKITYRARDGKAEDLLQAFRNSLNPRIVVTVDMIATGTDVKPLECLIFMRTVKSRTYFEQMIGRGVRVMDDTDFQSVTDDSKHKDRFIVVDAVGVTDTDLIETTLPLERKPTKSLGALMKMVGFGNAEPDLASTIAGRLARLDTRLPEDEQELLSKLAGGVGLGDLAHSIVEALDPDNQLATVQAAGESADDPAAVKQAATNLIAEALKPLATNPELRTAILDVQKSFEQTIDEVSKDVLLEAGPSEEGREKVAALVNSFRDYIEEHKDDIRALEVLYSRSHKDRLTFPEIKEFAHAIERPPRRWTPRSSGTPTRCSTGPRFEVRADRCSRILSHSCATPSTKTTSLSPSAIRLRSAFRVGYSLRSKRGRRSHLNSFNGSYG